MAKELNTSPKEALELPASLIAELMCVHQEVESYKLEEINKNNKV
jgi:hypothetical protein